MAFKIPKRYRQKITPDTTEFIIKEIKDSFQKELSEALNLRRVTAPLFVLSDTGINDNLTGKETPVTFAISALGDKKAEVVHSLAKWKRSKLAAYGIPAGYGLYTDMNAIRAFEELDNTHSLYVDQWDWEMTISEGDRTTDFLKQTVEKIFRAVKNAEREIFKKYPHITPTLPESVTFVNSQDLIDICGEESTPKEREHYAAKKYGAVFIIGIGDKLSDGRRHDDRSPDYDDWTTPRQENGSEYTGLNGDLILWNTVLEEPFELSSMGIRVDKEALLRQLEICGCEDRLELPFHKSLLNGELPLSIGGGIGQSRLCMFLLQKAHIGEVQSSIWPEEQIEECKKAGITLL
ncbi:MAG: aspartate--ammonia ligase [Clostridium sp.]|nr:aspartate--ammonia ligase [Clostridium sp.]